MAGKLRVTQVKSTISHIARNRGTIRALGLPGIGAQNDPPTEGYQCELTGVPPDHRPLDPRQLEQGTSNAHAQPTPEQQAPGGTGRIPAMMRTAVPSSGRNSQLAHAEKSIARPAGFHAAWSTAPRGH
jgi:hypothetical protein